ncbi:MAG: benzoate/H(+) symporter BenE family transporter, partial [Hyphomicrobiales bacterium]|nr:benzoate/H(+) symporter BenE family transporter [Hyphomicrobiales bacterium]
MPSPIESPPSERLTLRRAFADLGPQQFANGTIGFIFAATGPVAIVLSAARKGGLSDDAIASWLFGCFLVNGLITLAMTWAYRRPLSFFWTIPGTVLAGQALTHLSFPQVVGAFYASSLLIVALGATGLARRALDWVPMPIVMGMVAGVFLRFGLDLVRALHGDPLLAWAMVATFLALSFSQRVARVAPPILGALVVGVALSLATQRLDAQALGALAVARPAFAAPVFSLQAMVELVVPLAITVLVVQNAQGFAILQAAGHAPPANAVTLACGVGGLLSAAVGAVGTCLTGPTNAIIVSSGDRERHYAGALVTGALAVLFGIFSPT